MITRKYVVYGRVQGVGFRYFTRTMAEAFDMRGSVRNLPDGGVEVIVCGDEQNHQGFREQIEIGPRGARVDRLDVAELPGERFTEFRVIP